jgi:hypothetical protein
MTSFAMAVAVLGMIIDLLKAIADHSQKMSPYCAPEYATR